MTRRGRHDLRERAAFRSGNRFGSLTMAALVLGVDALSRGTATYTWPRWVSGVLAVALVAYAFWVTRYRDDEDDDG